MKYRDKIETFVARANIHANVEYDVEVRILEWHDEVAVVGLIDGSLGCTAKVNLKVYDGDIPYNCEYVVWSADINNSHGHALIKMPADLFRLMYA